MISHTHQIHMPQVYKGKENRTKKNHCKTIKDKKKNYKAQEEKCLK